MIKNLLKAVQEIPFYALIIRPLIVLDELATTKLYDEKALWELECPKKRKEIDVLIKNKTMKKYKVTLTEEQMRLVSNCLEDISRFASGQCELEHTLETMLKDLPFDEQMDKRDKAQKHLAEIKKILLPELPGNASIGYNGTEFIGNTYQVYRTMLYALTEVKEDVYNVYSSPALPSGNMGIIKIEEL